MAAVFTYLAMGVDASPAGDPVRPQGSVQELMATRIDPTADALWDSVAFIAYEKGDSAGGVIDAACKACHVVPKMAPVPLAAGMTLAYQIASRRDDRFWDCSSSGGMAEPSTRPRFSPPAR